MAHEDVTLCQVDRSCALCVASQSTLDMFASGLCSKHHKVEIRHFQCLGDYLINNVAFWGGAEGGKKKCCFMKRLMIPVCWTYKDCCPVY